MRPLTPDTPTLDFYGQFHAPNGGAVPVSKGAPDDCDRRLPGELTFSDARGGRLKVFGYLSGQDVPPLHGEFFDTVHGTNGGTFVALYDCYRTSIDFGDPEYARCQYSPREVLVLRAREIEQGWNPRLFDKIESLRCTGFSITSKLHMQHWIGQSHVASYARSEDSFPLRRSSGPPVTEHGTTAELSFVFPQEHTVFSRSVEQATRLNISFDEPRPLHGPNGIYHLVHLLHGLVAITGRKSVSVEDIALTFTQDGLDPLHAGLHRKWLENDSAHPDPAMWQIPMPFDVIGGLQGIVKWVNAANRYWLPMARVASRWLTPTSYLTSKFADVYSALEAIARIQAGIPSSGNELKRRVGGMNKVLERLAQGRSLDKDEESESVRKSAFGSFGQLVGDVKAWAKAMARVRSRLVIHPGVDSYSGSGEADLPRLFETGYALAVMWLLHEAGIGSGAGRAACDVLAGAPNAKPPGGGW